MSENSQRESTFQITALTVWGSLRPRRTLFGLLLLKPVLAETNYQSRRTGLKYRWRDISLIAGA